jgi:hypothetical protein
MPIKLHGIGNEKETKEIAKSLPQIFTVGRLFVYNPRMMFTKRIHPLSYHPHLLHGR